MLESFKICGVLKAPPETMTSRVAETDPGVPDFPVGLDRGSARYRASPYR